MTDASHTAVPQIAISKHDPSKLQTIPTEILFEILESIEDWNDIVSFRLVSARLFSLQIPSKLYAKHSSRYIFRKNPTTKLYRSVSENQFTRRLFCLANIRAPSKLLASAQEHRVLDYETSVIAALTKLSNVMRCSLQNSSMLEQYRTKSNSTKPEAPTNKLAQKIAAGLSYVQRRSTHTLQQAAEPHLFLHVLRLFDLLHQFESQIQYLGYDFTVAWGNCTLRVNHLARVREVFGSRNKGCCFIQKFVAEELCRIGMRLSNLSPNTDNNGLQGEVVSFSRFLDFVYKLEKVYRDS